MRNRIGKLTSVFFFAFVLSVASPRGWAGGVDELLSVMPADAPIAMVVSNFEKLDKSIVGMVKSVDPGATPPEVLADMKRDLPLAKWIDFSKPVGMIQPSVMGNGQPVLFAVVPEFAEKIKTVAAAKEENGVWTLPFEDGESVYAKVRGGYVMASPNADTLALAAKEGKTLAEELRGRMDLLKDRDVVFHVNFEPIRPMAAMGLMQLSQMAPMLAMMAGGQGGADPAVMTAGINSGVDAIKKFVDEVAYLDISVSLTDANGLVTLATGFKDGDIRSYLAKQKPAAGAFFTEIEDQPYLAAMGCHIPGTESPFFDFFFDKISAAMTAPAAAAPGVPGAAPAPAADPAKADAAKAAIQVSRDLYRKVEGWNSVMAFSPAGMRVSGDYLGADAAGILELTKKGLTASNPMMKSLGGAGYEPLGATKMGDVNVEQFAIKLDTTNPATAQAAQMIGENARFALGIAGGKVRYCMGPEADAKKVFTARVEKPLAANKMVAEAVAGVPAKKNALLLIDPAGLLPLIGPMMGMPKADPLPPGPPVAISVSLSGEPARVDLNVPFKAIARMVQALKPAPPPT